MSSFVLPLASRTLAGPRLRDESKFEADASRVVPGEFHGDVELHPSDAKWDVNPVVPCLMLVSSGLVRLMDDSPLVVCLRLNQDAVNASWHWQVLHHPGNHHVTLPAGVCFSG